jgi:hypothetical protein
VGGLLGGGRWSIWASSSLTSSSEERRVSGIQTSDADVSGGPATGGDGVIDAAVSSGAGAVAGRLRARGYCAGSGMGLSSISSAKGAAIDIYYTARSVIDTRRRCIDYFILTCSQDMTSERLFN